MRDLELFRRAIAAMLSSTLIAGWPRAAVAQLAVEPGTFGQGSSRAAAANSPRLPTETEVATPERPPAALPPTPQPMALEAPIDPDHYICGRGDVFELNFWGPQNFKLRLPVDAEGRTFISKVGYVELGGKTLTEVRGIVRRAVLRMFPGLNFDLSLVEIRTFLVHLVDNVKNPGVYPARPVDRVTTALAKAGGSTASGSSRRIEIVHRDGKKAIADLLLYNLTGDVRYNPVLADGDVVRVPFEGLTVTIDGAVRRPGRYELTDSKDLVELLSLAGGPSSLATRQLPLRLVRKDPASERDRQIDVAFTDPPPATALTPDDVVTVPSKGELSQSILLVGAVVGSAPSDEATTVRRMPFVAGDTVRTLLERAGGVAPGADLQGALLRHERGEDEPVDLEALLVRRDFSADKGVQIGDTLIVPFRRRSVIVEGAVFRPAAYPYNPAFGVRQYLALAGGLTRFAQDVSEVRVMSLSGETRPLREATKVGPGDTIVVPERDFSRSEIVQLVISGAGLLLGAAAIGIAAFKR